ncbi:major facilitator superfamily protein [Hirsutella rhossiliensis]|uniref:Major facilitator superfamily domain-containing protein n=1 Tax=Hirsutella rhossiliensis TaxID=111463 RepID=A0A9P8N6L1_9HYPO|nr:major facilitator superfamily domain-containing protein [Hirsutella rhossiliensis]KAH0967492.1 major facilitator superfamily domain-containing protein [Hirsutella rhossiliensis]
MDVAPGGSNRHMPNRGPAVFAVTTATLILASVFVGARIFCRHFIVRNLSWDDKVMILAWLIAFFLSFTIDLGTVNGLGKYDVDISSQDLSTLRRCEYVFSILYNLALMATKTSILIFYLRLAKNTQVVLRYASWATLVVVNISGLVLTFMNVFQCNPIPAAWMSEFTENSSCIPLLTEFICAAPVNIVTDLAVLALPIPVLTSMRLPSRQKTIIVLTFTLGIFVTIVDVVRIYYLQRAISEADFAWNASLSLMWSAVEVNVGMACACVPTLKPLILKLLPSMLVATPAAAAVASGSIHPSSPGDEGPVSVLDFLTTPDMTSLGNGPPSPSPDPATRARTNGTASTTATAENGVYFGFVNLTKPKSMLKANGTESLKYCTIVSILFFLWGLSYGLLNTLNNAVAAVNEITPPQTLGLTSAYFGGGYFFGPLLVGEWILRRDEHNRTKRHGKNGAESVGGFKVTFIVGLCIYGMGTIIFWPSAVTNSYGGFMLSNFVVGFGLSVLEVGANAFMILCGPPEYGETRLLLAQGVQGIGSVISGVLAEKVFFKGIAQDNMSNSMTLINVQWTYLGITLLCVVLGLFFYYMPLPEVCDSELERSASHLPVDPQKRSIGGLQLRTVSLALAVFAQYTYVGGGEPAYDPDKPPGVGLSIPDYLLPRTYLTISVVLAFICALLPVVLRPPNPTLLVIPVTLIFFAEGPIWPLIFAIGLRGQGRRTKRAAAFITMGGSGPAFFPFIMYGIITTGGSVQIAFIVVIALQVALIVHPLFLELCGDARRLVDPCPDLRYALRNDDASADEVVAARHTDSRSTRERASDFFHKASKGFETKLATGLRKASDAEHSEGSAGSSPRTT